MNMQGTEEWFAQRRGKITASRMADVIRHSPRYLEQLRAELRGEIVEKQYPRDSPPLAWGKKHEPMAIGGYELRFGVDVRMAGFMVHPTVPYVGASVDGLVDPDGTVEVKCPIDEDIHLLTLGFGVPDQHLFQIQSGLWVSGRQWCDFVSFDPRRESRQELYVERVPRMETMIAGIAKACEEFWQMVLAENVEPITRRPYEVEGGIPNLF